MRGSNQLAAYLPYTFGALVVGGALTGSFVTPSRRARLERYLLLPLYAVATVGLFALLVWQHDWLPAAISMLAAIFVCVSLYRRVRIAEPGEHS